MSSRRFPLFDAPLELARTDEAGQCDFCGRFDDVRFDRACFECFRAGKPDRTMMTELGMVRREDAERGLTHGLPLAAPDELPGWELVAHPVDANFPNENWYSVRVEPAELRELLRTPKYHSWQGVTWLFCCKKAMVFTGELALEPLRRRAGETGRSPEELVAELLGSDGGPFDGEELLERIEAQRLSTYSFVCRSCGKLRAYYDMD